MKISIKISFLLAILSIIASGVGLFTSNLYQDNDLVSSIWRSNDWITCIAVGPALFLALWSFHKGNSRAYLVWMGLLGYLLYNYAFYLIGAAFNSLFLIYVMIFSGSIFALIFGLGNMPFASIKVKRELIPKWLVIYLLAIALMLVLVELPSALMFIFTDKLPDLITRVDHPTSIVHALDLSLVVPFSIYAAVKLWQDSKWGYILTAIMLVKGATYGLVLLAASLVTYLSEHAGDPLWPFYTLVCAGGLVGIWWLLKNIEIKATKSPYSDNQ